MFPEPDPEKIIDIEMKDSTIVTVSIPSELVHVGLSVAGREELFTTMAAQLERLGYVRSTFLEGLLARESRFPTGLPISGGVAIPHTDPEHVRSSCISIATLKSPVPFGQMGGDDEEIPVRLVLMLALHESDDHLTVLQQMLKNLRNTDFVEELLASDSTPGIVERTRAVLDP